MLLSFVHVANLKEIILTTGIDTHASHVVLRPLEEIVALSGRPLSAYPYNDTHYERLLLLPIISCNPLKLQHLCLK